jgi:hypothetical protein
MASDHCKCGHDRARHLGLWIDKGPCRDCMCQLFDGIPWRKGRPNSGPRQVGDILPMAHGRLTMYHNREGAARPCWIMASLLVILLVVALIVWLIAQFAPLPGWVGKAALIVWLCAATLLVAGVRFSTNA